MMWPSGSSTSHSARKVLFSSTRSISHLAPERSAMPEGIDTGYVHIPGVKEHYQVLFPSSHRSLALPFLSSLSLFSPPPSPPSPSFSLFSPSPPPPPPPLSLSLSFSLLALLSSFCVPTSSQA